MVRIGDDFFSNERSDATKQIYYGWSLRLI